MMCFRPVRSLFPCIAALATLAACGSKVEYPKCDSDEQCKEKGEVCVNGQCQECADTPTCVQKRGEGYECVSGRCDVKPECRADGDCKDGLVCRSNKCVPECTTNDDCPSGRKCESQKCVAECSVDIDCGPGRQCVGGACQDPQRQDTKISSACRPATGSGDVINAQTVSFDFDKFDLRIDARQSLDQTSECLKQAPQVTLIIEGHADDRGTQEYNLALGEKRANTVRDYLRRMGIDTSRMRTRSKGENEPLCQEASDDCWARNRRVEFIQSMR